MGTDDGDIDIDVDFDEGTDSGAPATFTDAAATSEAETSIEMPLAEDTQDVTPSSPPPPQPELPPQPAVQSQPPAEPLPPPPISGPPEQSPLSPEALALMAGEEEMVDADATAIGMALTPEFLAAAAEAQKKAEAERAADANSIGPPPATEAPSTDEIAGGVANARVIPILATISDALGDLDVDAGLVKAVHELVRATQSAYGLVVLSGAGGQFEFRASSDAQGQPHPEPPAALNQNVASSVISDGKSLSDADAGADAWLNRNGPPGIVPVLGVPLRLRRMTLGLVFLAREPNQALFSDAEAEFVSVGAFAIAQAIDSERNKAAAAPTKIESNGTSPHLIRQALMPASSPAAAGWEYSTFVQFFEGPDGDVHDISVPYAGGLTCFVADVTDRESVPGVFTAMTRGVLKSGLPMAPSLADASVAVHRSLTMEAPSGSEVTMFFGRFDTSSGDLAYVNANHPPALIFRNSESQLFSLAATGPAFSSNAAAAYEERSIRLFSGDFVVMITNGVIDAIDPEGNPFGWERLQQILLENRHSSAVEISRAIDRAVNMFTTGAFHGDATVLVVKRL